MAGQEWRLYDVGGARSTVSTLICDDQSRCRLTLLCRSSLTQRAAWYPFFDDGEP